MFSNYRLLSEYFTAHILAKNPVNCKEIAKKMLEKKHKKYLSIEITYAIL